MSNNNQNWNDRNREYQKNQEQSKDPEAQVTKDRPSKKDEDLSSQNYSEQREHMIKKHAQDSTQAEKKEGNA